jgi:hypothetical protein
MCIAPDGRSAPFGRWHSLTFLLVLPPYGGPGNEKRNLKPSTSKGHMPTLHWRSGWARHIQPERYATLGLQLGRNKLIENEQKCLLLKFEFADNNKSFAFRR